VAPTHPLHPGGWGMHPTASIVCLAADEADEAYEADEADEADADSRSRLCSWRIGPMLLVQP